MKTLLFHSQLISSLAYFKLRVRLSLALMLLVSLLMMLGTIIYQHLKRAFAALSLAAVVTSSTAIAQVPAGVPWATPNGQITQNGIMAATCGVLSATPAAEQFTFGMIDVRGANTAPMPANDTDYANLWYAPMYHHPDWTLTKIGNVFGICFDADGDAYVSASSSFSAEYGGRSGLVRYGDIGGGANALSAAGTVYKIDKTTGIPTVFCQLPQQLTTLTYGGFPPLERQTGPGLGDVCFDSRNNQFFVSNFEDGKIYRVSSSGTVLDSFDPFVADDNSAGYASLKERIWAIQIYDNRLYFGNCEGSSAPDLSLFDRRWNIYSVALSTSGAFSGTELVAATFVTTEDDSICQTSDIAFNATGQMLVASRTMTGNFTSYNHNAKVRLFVKNVPNNWSLQNTISPGHNLRESYGGADWGYDGATKEGFIWAASADMLKDAGPHGLQGWRLMDTPSNGQLSWGRSVMIPFLPSSQNPEALDIKGFGGDLEIYEESTTCAITSINVTPGACNDNGTASDQADDYYTASVTVNFSTPPATGNLVISGAALHSSNTVTTVAVGSTTSATTHTFTGVRLKANGAANALTATFSADAACTLTTNAPSVNSCSGSPSNCCPELIITLPK